MKKLTKLFVILGTLQQIAHTKHPPKISIIFKKEKDFFSFSCNSVYVTCNALKQETFYSITMLKLSYSMDYSYFLVATL